MMVLGWNLFISSVFFMILPHCLSFSLMVINMIR